MSAKELQIALTPARWRAFNQEKAKTKKGLIFIGSTLTLALTAVSVYKFVQLMEPF